MISGHKKLNLTYTKAWLRKNFPSEYPIKITLKKQIWYKDFPEELDAITLFDTEQQRFLIQLSKKLNTECLVETLLHEYAHVLRNHAPDQTNLLHDEVYWAIYGQIYRKWHGED